MREVARGVAGVLGTHKCHFRGVGFDFFVDLDVLCDPDATIRKGHEVVIAQNILHLVRNPSCLKSGLTYRVGKEHNFQPD